MPKVENHQCCELSKFRRDEPWSESVSRHSARIERVKKYNFLASRGAATQVLELFFFPRCVIRCAFPSARLVQGPSARSWEGGVSWRCFGSRGNKLTGEKPEMGRIRLILECVAPMRADGRNRVTERDNNNSDKTRVSGDSETQVPVQDTCGRPLVGRTTVVPGSVV